MTSSFDKAGIRIIILKSGGSELLWRLYSFLITLRVQPRYYPNDFSFFSYAETTSVLHDGIYPIQGCLNQWRNCHYTHP